MTDPLRPAEGAIALLFADIRGLEVHRAARVAAAAPSGEPPRRAGP